MVSIHSHFMVMFTVSCEISIGFFYSPTLVTRRKTSFSISLPSSKLTISTYSIYKHDAIDIVDPNSMQDACHMNFVIDPTHQTVSMAQW